MKELLKSFRFHRSAWLTAMLAFALFAVVSFTNHIFFRTYALDLGLYTNALYDYAHFRFADTSLFLPENKNLLADHFDLYLMLFSPLSWIFKSYTLLVVQAVAVIIGGFGIYFLLNENEATRQYRIWGMAMFYLFFGTLAALAYDYHSNVISAMALPFYFLMVNRKSWLKAFALLVFMFLGKENVSLFLFFVSLGLFWKYFNSKESRKYILLFAGFSIVYFLFMVKWVMPTIAGEKDFVHFGKYPVLGGDMTAAIKFMITHPLEFIRLLFVNHMPEDPTYNNEKVYFYLVLFVAGGWALFVRPWYFLMIIPIIIQKELTNQPSTWGCVYQYSIEFAPVVIIALIETVSKWKFNANRIGVVLLFFTLSSTVYGLAKRSKAWEKERFVFWQKPHFKPHYDLADVKVLMEKIPADASVMANSAYVGQLAYRDKCYTLPLVKDSEFILVSSTESTYPLSVEQTNEMIQAIQVDTTWNLLEQRGHVYLFQRKP
jgi:uncharacterized membrane protein